jgi:uroporphyrinogen decarboxylase
MLGEQAHAEFEEQLYQDVVELFRALDLDMLHPPWRKSERPALQLDEYTFVYGDPDGDHDVYRHDPVAKTFGVSSQVRKRPMASPDELEPGVEAQEAASDAFTVGDPWGAAGAMGRMQREFGDEYEVTGGVGISIPLNETWLTACAVRPDLVARSLDAQLVRACRQLEAQAAIGLKVIWGGGDLADKNGPVYGPRIFRQLVLPRAQKLVRKCEALGLWYVYRTDGNLWPIEREFFVDSGIHGYGEIDHDAGMELSRLKPLHGDRVTFWGNVPTGSVLYRGSERQVREFTRQLIDVAATGGGFILGTSNSVLPGTPAKNVVALFDDGRKYGGT